MTLRYGHDGKPVGLDWSVCNDGKPRPEVWQAFSTPAKSKQAKAVRKPKEPREGQASRNRTAPEIEQQIITLYRDHKLPANEVGRRCGLTAVTVFKVLKRNGVTTRSRAEAMAIYQESR